MAAVAATSDNADGSRAHILAECIEWQAAEESRREAEYDAELDEIFMAHPHFLRAAAAMPSTSQSAPSLPSNVSALSKKRKPEAQHVTSSAASSTYFSSANSSSSSSFSRSQDAGLSSFTASPTVAGSVSSGVRRAALADESEQGHRYAATAVCWYPFDTGLFFSGGMDQLFCTWDTNTMTAVARCHVGAVVHALAASPIAAHALVAVASRSHAVRLCDVRSGGIAQSLIGHRGDTTCVAWSPSGEFTLVSGAVDQTIRVWDVRRAGCVALLDMRNENTHSSDSSSSSSSSNSSSSSGAGGTQSHTGTVSQLVFDRDPSFMLSAACDGSLRRWCMVTHRNTLVNYHPTQNFNRRNRFCVSAHAPVVYFPVGAHIHVFEAATGRLLRTLKGHFGHVSLCAYNPRRRELYSCAEQTVLAWDTGTAGVRAAFAAAKTSHSQSGRAATISSSSSSLFSSSSSTLSLADRGDDIDAAYWESAATRVMGDAWSDDDDDNGAIAHVGAAQQWQRYAAPDYRRGGNQQRRPARGRPSYQGSH